MGQLMLIAVSVEDGTSQATVNDNGKTILDPQQPPRVVGCLDEARFYDWVRDELKGGKMRLPEVHGYPDGSTPTEVGVIRFSHHSPGQVCVDFNGVPICFPP